MGEGTAGPRRELLPAHRQEIKAIVARHHGRSIAVFGSVARGDESATSDRELLVELEPDARPSEILALGADLEEILGVKVDIGMPESLGAGRATWLNDWRRVSPGGRG